MSKPKKQTMLTNSQIYSYIYLYKNHTDLIDWLLDWLTDLFLDCLIDWYSFNIKLTNCKFNKTDSAFIQKYALHPYESEQNYTSEFEHQIASEIKHIKN